VVFPNPRRLHIVEWQTHDEKRMTRAKVDARIRHMGAHFSLGCVVGLSVALALSAVACGSDSEGDGAGGKAGTGGTAGSGGTGGSGGSGGATGGSGGVSGTPGDGGSDADADVPKQSFRYVTDAITLPHDNAKFMADVDGDATPENQLGQIISAFVANVDIQAAQDASIAAGVGLELFELKTSDTALQNDASAQLLAFRATTTPSPDFSGTGAFTIDSAVTSITLAGALSSGVFLSTPPPNGAAPPKLMVRVALFGDLPVIGARVTFSTTATGLTQGQINGAVVQADVDAVIVPSLTQHVDSMVKQVPCTDECMTAQQIFDTNDDGMVSETEFKSNPLVQSVLQPDVDLIDGAGNYSPTVTNANPDSLSVGFGFTAVKATFTP
jgi:hypothetical protein